MPSKPASRSPARRKAPTDGSDKAAASPRPRAARSRKRRARPDPRVLASLVDRLPDIVFRYRLRPTPRYEYISPAVEALTGHRPSDFYADPLFDEKVVHPDDRPALLAAIARQTTGPIRLRWLRKDHGSVWIEVNAVPYKNRKGEVIGLEGVARDVSDRVTAEGRVRQLQGVMAALLNSSPDPFSVITTEGLLVDCNEAYSRLFRRKPEDLIGGSVSDRWPADAETRTRQLKTAARRRKRTIFYNQRVGNRRYDITMEPVLDEAGKTMQFAIFGRDVTRRHRMEASLRASEERFRILYEDNPTMYFTVDANGIVLSVNKFGAEQLGYQPEELIGKEVLSVFHPDDRRAVQRQLRRCIESDGEVHDWEFRKVRKDGETMWVEEAARTTEGPDGSKIILIVCEDVTERRRMEEELQQAREELERKVEKTLEKENPYDLTFRQLTVLHLVVQGKSDREIGLALGISPLTVNTHVSRALRKMGASSRTEAGVRALREGLIE